MNNITVFPGGIGAEGAVDQADSWQCDAMRLRCEF